MYEQRLASISTMSSNTTAASLLGYNPFMMGTSPFASLGCFPPLNSAMAAAAAAGGIGAMTPADYAAAASAMAGFPAVPSKLGILVLGNISLY